MFIVVAKCLFNKVVVTAFVYCGGDGGLYVYYGGVDILSVYYGGGRIGGEYVYCCSGRCLYLLW